MSDMSDMDVLIKISVNNVSFSWCFVTNPLTTVYVK